MILTSINAGADVIDGIHCIARDYNLSTGDVVNHLARIILRKGKFKLQRFSTVRYQPDMPGEYKQFRIRLDDEIYESCQDFRKLFKLSVSRFICEGFFVFYEELITSLSGSPRIKGCFHDSYYYAISYSVETGEYNMEYRRKTPPQSG